MPAPLLYFFHTISIINNIFTNSLHKTKTFEAFVAPIPEIQLQPGFLIAKVKSLLPSLEMEQIGQTRIFQLISTSSIAKTEEEEHALAILDIIIITIE